MNEFSEVSYKREYANLGGEERKLGPGAGIMFSTCGDWSRSLRCRNCGANPVEHCPELVPLREANMTEPEKKAIQLYRDLNWVDLPRKMVWKRGPRGRRVKDTKVIVADLLIKLSPAVVFNPLNALNDDGPAAVKSAVKSKKEEMIEKAEFDREEREVAREIATIRSWCGSRDINLTSKVRQIKKPRAREILLIEIMKKALDAFKTEAIEKRTANRAEVYDILWVVESMVLSSQETAKENKKDCTLVYDDFKNVKKLIKEAQDLRAGEKDLIEFQLTSMSDRLPPLSKFSFGFRLDAWQLRAMEFIKAGKSVVICAPTSSGKTVMSAYVAIGKSKRVAGIEEAKEGEQEEEDEDAPDGDEDGGDDIGDNPEDADEPAEIEDISPRLGIDPDTLRFDRLARLRFRLLNPDGSKRVLFVLPTEPLVWQVAAFFTKLLREEGDKNTRVALVTNMLTYYPERTFNIMPQIVVGTPLALESALTKPRGLIRDENWNRAINDLLPGGFEHFDWAIYDEVHSLDGEEGDALQRIIRSMTCKFLALSATVGNASELQAWMEHVKGEQLVGVEAMTVLPTESHYYGSPVDAASTEGERDTAADAEGVRGSGRSHGGGGGGKATKSSSKAGGGAVAGGGGKGAGVKEKSVKAKKGEAVSVSDKPVNIAISRVVHSLTGPVTTGTITVENCSPNLTLVEFRRRVWSLLPAEERDADPASLRIEQNGTELSYGRDEETLKSDADDGEDEEDVALKLASLSLESSSTLSLVTFSLKVARTVDNEALTLDNVSPNSTIKDIKERIASRWTMFRPDGLQLQHLAIVRDGPVLVSAEATVVRGKVLQLQGDASQLKRGSVLIIGPMDGEQEIVNVVSCEAVNDTTWTCRVTDVTRVHPARSPCALVSVLELGHIDTVTMAECGIFRPGCVSFVQMRSLVNLISHQGRFINLQRFLFTGGKLDPISPLAAVETVDSLAAGTLDNSGLSFTSKDLARLWDAISNLYPPSVVGRYSPQRYFSSLNTSRITLQQTKDYEELLKRLLKDLAQSHPNETQELLHKFHIENPDREVDLCELLFKIEEKDMLPCLVFHLNSFEAVGIFKQILAGLEWRQKSAFPTYYMDLEEEYRQKNADIAAAIKGTGGNALKLQQLAQSGQNLQEFSMDIYEPHMKFQFGKACMSKTEYKDLCDEMERYDGFKARLPQAMEEQAGENEFILAHALMRGLRRGIGLYINEVSFPAYRRAVQRLASQGKLAVVVSDDSLAFGVNMPFRTCVFVGEMKGRLTALMAQQMAGRSGRRGLDTQGNLVYAGSRASFIRDIMIGHVANITGEIYEPRYPTMFLQGVLSTRHVGWNRMATLGAGTLNEFVTGSDVPARNYAMSYSKHLMIDLGFIQEAGDAHWEPVRDYSVLNLIWELRGCGYVSILIGRVLPQIHEEMTNKLAELRDNRRFKEGNSAVLEEKEKIRRLNLFFFSIILPLVDRVPHDPRRGLPPLHEHSDFSTDHPQQLALLNKWTRIFKEDFESYAPEHLARFPDIRCEIGPDTPLDSAMYECVRDRNFMFTLDTDAQQELKGRIWRVGTVLKAMHNMLWTNSKYFNELEPITRSCYRSLRYLNAEIMRDTTNFVAVCDVALERREHRERGRGGADFPSIPREALPWADITAEEMAAVVSRSSSTTWVTAAECVVKIAREWKLANPTATAGALRDYVSSLLAYWGSLHDSRDCAFIVHCVEFKPTDAGITSVAFTSPATPVAGSFSPYHIIGALAWAVTKLYPTVHPGKSVVNSFPVYLKYLLEFDGADLVSDVQVRAWLDAPAAVNLESTPVESGLTEADIGALKSSPHMAPFRQWLDTPDDDDDDDDEDEDEED